MRFMKVLAGAVVTVMVGLAVGGSSAQAAECPSEQSVLPYSENDPAYQCAQHAWSGNKSIAAWDTKSWTNSTAIGYSVKTHCNYRSDGDVTVTEAWAQSSYTATATNWDVGTRHFAAGVIFTTGKVDSGSYGSGCATNDGKMKNGIQKITQNVKLDGTYSSAVITKPKTITGTVSPSDATGYVALTLNGVPAMNINGDPVAGPISGGKFSITWTPWILGTYQLGVAYPGDTSKCQAAAKSCGFTGGASSTQKIVISPNYSTNPVPDSEDQSVSTGNVAAVSTSSGNASDEARVSGTSDSGVVLKQKSATMPGGISVNCPSGTVPLHAELFGANTGRSLKYSQAGVSLKSGAVAEGRKASVQLICREKNHSLKPSNRLGLGTAGADRLQTSAIDGTLMGGPGKDRLKVVNRRGVAHGGLGDDKITVKRNGGVATGGPGADVIRSKTSGRSLLVGGPGRDRIITSVGNTLVDSRDGRRDKVVCKGANSHVRADARDRLVGHCHRV